MFLYRYCTYLVLIVLVIIATSCLSSCSANELDTPEQAMIVKTDNSAARPVHATAKHKIQQFEFVYEPSGILALPDGEILAIEDEARQAFSVLAFGKNGDVFRTPISKPRKFSPGRLEDLEGLAGDDAGHYFAITSHSKTPKGRLPRARKKLVRFTLDNYAMDDVFTISNLKKKLLKEYSGIRKNISGRKSDLNIEALSYHREKQYLMLGLRSPLIDDAAVLIVISNPVTAFSKDGEIDFAKKLITLDLDKGGIRAMAYDENLSGYLILSRREDKKDKSFKLWLWDGKTKHKPQRIRFDGDFGLDFAEGVAPISTKSMTGLLIVFDDGNALKAKGAHYAFLPYEKLKVEGL